MKLDFTPVFAAFGIGLATYLVLRLRKVSPDVKFKDVKYNKLKNEIQLVVENVSDEAVYVKPALRVIRLSSADEWKAKNFNNSPVPMMTASAGSVIKGYELIGEYAEAVGVEPKKTTVITYPVMRDFGLKAYDNIRVDSPVGNDPSRMVGSVSGTVRMNIKDLMSEEASEELLSFLNEQLRVEAAHAPFLNGGLIQPVVSGLEKDGGKLDVESVKPALDVKRSEFPVDSMCYCCGKSRWLNWVVGGNHVCQECKDFLGKDNTLVFNGTGAVDLEEDLDTGGPGLGVEFVDSAPVDLKPRHRKILDMLLNESTLSIKELSNRLDRDTKSVASDLRYLLRNNLVDRVKIKGKYKYFSLRDGEQIVLLNPTEEQPERPEWT